MSETQVISSIPDAMRRYGLSRHAVENGVRDGVIPSIRIGERVYILTHKADALFGLELKAAA